MALIGREREIARLVRLRDDARAGRSGALLVVGEPGAGKTALLDDCVATAQGLRVLRASGYEMETDLPFAGLAALVRPLAAGVDRLPAPQSAALAGALGTGPPVPPGDRFTVYTGALTLLADAAERTPLLLAVDDAHWLDPASLDALAFVARRLAGEGIALLMAAREEPTGALERVGGIPVVHLRGLSATAAGDLVRALRGADLGEAVPERLVAATGGNPLALVTAAQTLTDAHLAGSDPLPDPLPVGSTITRAVRARLAPLTAATRRALLVVAAGEGGHTGLVREAMERAELDGALEVPGVDGLVEVSGAGVRFLHPLVRSSVYAAATPAERRSVHAALASVARDRGEEAMDDLARHLAAAADGPDEAVASALEAAGRRAAARMAYAESAAYLARAADATPDPRASARRLLAAGTTALMAGRSRLARECIERCLARAVEPDVVDRARTARGHLELWTGRVRLASEYLAGEAERLRGSSPEAAALALFDAAMASTMTGGSADRGRALAATAEELARGRGPTLEYLTAMMAACQAVTAGEADARARIRSLPDPLSVPPMDDPLHWARIGIAVNTLIIGGWFREARGMADRLIGVGRALSAPSMLPYPAAVRAEILSALGDWDGVEAGAVEAMELGDETGQEAPAAFARCVLARVVALRGESERCRALADEAERGMARHETAIIGAYVDHARALDAAGAGRPAEALDHLLRIDEAIRRADMRAHTPLPYLPDLVEVAARLGRDEVAGRALARLRTLDRSGIPRTMAAVARCEGILAADADEAAALLRDAADIEEREGLPFERARSLLLLGERLRQTRRRGEAREALSTAHDILTALRAGPWADRAAEGLAGLGLRPRPRAGGDVGLLTPRELQVARAAAEGRTNREIASDLFLSVKTVEFHLRNAYATLGVRSRTEMARRLLPERSPAVRDLG